MWTQCKELIHEHGKCSFKSRRKKMIQQKLKKNMSTGTS